MLFINLFTYANDDKGLISSILQKCNFLGMLHNILKYTMYNVPLVLILGEPSRVLCTMIGNF